MILYIALNLVFIGLALGIIRRLKTHPELRYLSIILAVMLPLTLLFDSLIIYFEIVGYDTAKILGVYLWKAPIEDFAYALVAAILIPYIWKGMDKK